MSSKGSAPARFCVQAELPHNGSRVHFLAEDLIATYCRAIGGLSRCLSGNDPRTGETRWTLVSEKFAADKFKYAILPDGKSMVAVQGDKPCCVSRWAFPVQGAPVHERVLAECQAEVQSMEIDHEGKELFVVAESIRDEPKLIHVYNLENGSPLRTLKVPWDSARWGYNMSHSPAGAKLAVLCNGEGTSGHEDDVLVLDAQDGRLLRKAKHASPCACLKWSCDGGMLGMVDFQQHAWIWDVDGEDQRAVLVWALKVAPNTQCMCFSPDGTLVAVGSGAALQVSVFELQGGMCVQIFRGPTSYVNDVAFSPDGATLVAPTGDLNTWVWHLDMTETFRTIPVESTQVMDFAFSPDGSEIATCGEDKTPKRWSVLSGEALPALQGTAPSTLTCIDYSPDGTRLATGCHDGSLLLWDLAPAAVGPRACSGKFKHAGAVHRVAYAPEGFGRIATSSEDTTAQLWTDEGDPICTLKGHTREIDSLIFAPSGQLITGGRDAIMKFWDPKTGDLIRSTEPNLYGDGAWYTSVSFAPDGQSFALSRIIGKTRVFETQTDKLIATLDYGQVSAFSPDGKFLVTVKGDQGVAVWDTEAWSECEDPVRTVAGPDPWVWVSRGVAFSPRDPWLFAAIKHNMLYLFDINATRAPPTSKMLRDRLAEDEGSSEKDDFRRTADALGAYPAALLLPIDFGNGIKKSLVQKAMEGTRGVEFLLSIAAPAKFNDDEEYKAKQRVAFAAYMQPYQCRTSGQVGTVLSYALDNRSSLLVQEILNSYLRILEDEREQPPAPEIQPKPQSERIQLWEILRALQQCPGMTIEFLEAVKTAPHALGAVLGNRERYEFPTHDALLRGSMERAPRSFWGDGTEEDAAEEQPLAEPRPLKRGGDSVSPRGEGFVELAAEPLLPDASKGSYVVAALVPLKGVAGPSVGDTTFLEAVVNACAARGTYHLMQSELLTAVIDFKWNSYGRQAFHRALALEIVYVATFTAAVVFFPSLVSDSPHWAPLVLLLTAVLLWLLRVCHELRQLCASGWKSYFFEDVWNQIDTVALMCAGFSMGCLGMGVLHGEHSFFSDAAGAIAMPFVYFKLLYYFQGTVEGGILVRIVLSITGRLWRFTIIIFVCMLGFAFSFFVLFRGSGDDIPWGFDTVSMTTLVTYDYILGDFNVHDFEHSESFGLAVMLFMVFMYFVQIVLLNLLISIMGDLYDEIQETASAQYLYMKARLVIEFEAGMTRSPANFPNWLQILRAQDEDKQTLWSGRVAYVKDHLGEMKHHIDKVMNRVKESESLLQNKIKTLEGRQKNTHDLVVTKLDAILNKLGGQDDRRSLKPDVQ